MGRQFREQVRALRPPKWWLSWTQTELGSTSKNSTN